MDDSTLIVLRDGTGVKEKYFDSYMERTFSYFKKNSETEERTDTPDVDYVWTGIQGYTPDGFPHIGGVPEEEGWYLMAGFNGGGMASIFEAARSVVQMMKDGRRAEETAIPKHFIANEERLNQGFEPDRGREVRLDQTKHT